MKYYIIAGEASGDLHASNLIKEIRKLDGQSSFRGWGGDLMQKQGADIVKHYRDLSFMGFAEVLMNLRTIVRNFSSCKNDIISFKPDVLILVDYPGFNLRIARFACNRGIRVFYYISPQLWAWNVSRVKQIKKNVEKMFVILPFEKEFYSKFGVKVDFVGHPLLDALVDAETNITTENIIAILPGSRKQEIRKMLPVMLSVIPLFQDYSFVIAGMSSVGKEFYEKYTAGYNTGIVFDNTYALLKKSTAAMVTSGTATLETAILDVPQLVCYKANPFSYLLAKRLARVNFIALPNIIAGCEVVKELIQNHLNTMELSIELRKLLSIENISTIKKSYCRIKSALGIKGSSERTASLMIGYLRKNNNNQV